jgi:hypothetical protein
MRNHGRTTATNGDGFRRLEVITGLGRRRRWTDGDKGKRRLAATGLMHGRP